jgi:fibronectin-binding autotransporter adhesin
MTPSTRKAPSAVSLPVPAGEIRTHSTALRFAVCLAMCLSPALVFAQNNVWNGGTGNWTDSTKWSTGVPTTTSNVLIDNGNSAASAVTVDTNPAQCNNLMIDSDDSLTVGSGQALYVGGSTVNNAGTLGVTAFSGYLFFSGSSPTISNTGTISLNALSNGTAGLNVSGTATLKGSGSVIMTNAAGNAIMGPYQPSPGASLTNQITIRGAGGIGGGGGIGAGNTFTNRATINANQTTPLIITNNTGETFINTGMLEATNGATLELAGGTITNTGGIIHAATGSAVVLQGGPTNGVTITGGTLSTSGTGTIQDNCCFNNSTLNGVTISTGSLFELNSNHNELWAGTITNNGTFQINDHNFTTALDMSGAVTLKGTGTLVMSNDSGNQIMGAYQPSPGASLTNQITIHGAGGIGGGGGIGAGNSFTNQATINADQTTPLIISNTTGETFINTGTLEATNGGTLELAGGTITNTGGIIHAATGSTVVLQSGPTNGVTITGGTLSTSGTGTIQDNCCFNTSTLDGVTINGMFQLNTNHNELWAGTITNNGTFQINDQNFTTALNMSGAVILKGPGTLTMSNDSGNQIMGGYQPSPGASLMNESTIQGAGSFGSGGIGAGNSLTNAGTIYADQSKALTIAVSTGTFTNRGTLKVKQGSAMYITGGGFTNFTGGNTLTGGKYMVSGTLGFDNAKIGVNAANITLTGSAAQIINDLNGAKALAAFSRNTSAGSISLQSGKILYIGGKLTNLGKVTVGAGSGLQLGTLPLGGYIQTAGNTTVDGALSALNGMNIQGGTLAGKGAIAAAVQSGGSVTAGDSAASPGKLSINGSYTQNSTGALNIAIGGLTAGIQYGQVAVTNGVSLNGTLNLTLINGFLPNIGDNFVIMTGSAISGTFATVNGLSINSGEHFAIAYNPANVTLTVVTGP